MSVLKRLSASFWSYVSPEKTKKIETATPQTVPKVKRHAAPPARHGSMKDVISKSRSMSPEERIVDWRKRSSTTSLTTGSKRKRGIPLTPSSGAGRHSKVLKMDDVDMLDVSSIDDEESDAMMSGALGYDDDDVEEGSGVYDEDGFEEDYDEDEEVADDTSLIRSHSRTSSQQSAYDNLKSPAVDEAEVLSDDEFTDGSPYKRKLISPEEAEFERDFSAEELREQGWDDDHITLVERLVLRGLEPVLPADWKFSYPWVPDNLFCKDDDSFVCSVKDEMAHSQKAFDELLEMSSRIRDGIFWNKDKEPKDQVIRSLPEMQGKAWIEKFTKWCDRDSGLDLKRAIPMLTIVARPKEVTSESLQRIARKKLARHAQQWKEAFRVRHSIENSPLSHASTVLSYPIPTLYAIIASHNLVALVAYRPDLGEEADIKSVLLMDNSNVNYDFWNALAVAVVVCHVRDVRVRIAEETGIGLKVPGMDDDELESDPDL